MELDIRTVRHPDRHPTVFQAYTGLATGETLVLVADEELSDLRQALDVEHPGGYDWEALSGGPEEWRVRITKEASSSLPRVLCDTRALEVSATAAGAVWKLPMRQRDLDSNVVQIPAAGVIEAHVGADLDVLVVVLQGSGVLGTELGEVPVHEGALVWLPRRSQRSFRAGPEGLRYLTVHQRRQGLGLVAAEH